MFILRIKLVSQELTGSENNERRSRAMTIALHVKSKIGSLMVRTKPDTDLSLIQLLERCNAIGISCLMNSVSKELWWNCLLNKLILGVESPGRENFFDQEFSEYKEK